MTMFIKKKAEMLSLIKNGIALVQKFHAVESKGSESSDDDESSRSPLPEAVGSSFVE
jgi:hypothetical protein